MTKSARSLSNKHGYIQHLYRLIMRFHNSIPYHFFRSGYAFPTWHYFFEMTRRCNLRCRMCQYREYFERTPPKDLLSTELSTDEWKNLIDQTGRWSLITFTGGEPWVRADFEELLTYASKKRRTHIITNGLLMTSKHVELCVSLAPRHLFSSGLISIGISIDGTSEIHDHIRGREGAFEDTMGKLRELVKQREKQQKRFPLLHVTSVLQEDNLDTLPELMTILASIPIDVYNITMEVRFTDLEGLGDVNPELFCEAALGLPRISPDRLQRCLERLQEISIETGLELRLPAMPISEILAYHQGGLDLRRFACRSAWTNLHISAQGNVYPCFIYKVGNVREQSLREIWNGESMRKFRQRIRNELYCICQGCCHLEFKK